MLYNKDIGNNINSKYAFLFFQKLGFNKIHLKYFQFLQYFH